MSRIKSFFEDGSGLSEFCARMRHILVVNVLWVLCSIPIITFGAATAAAYDALQFMTQAGNLKSGKLYINALRRHFKRATWLWLLLFCLTALILVCAYSFINSENKNIALLAAFFFFLLIYGMVMVYSFPVLVRSEGSTMEIVVFSMLCGLRYLPWSLLVIVLAVVPVIMFLFETYWFLYTGLLWFLYGFAIIAYVNQLIVGRVFKKLLQVTDFLMPVPEIIPEEAIIENSGSC